MQKVALVTGSSKGIGQAIALRLSQDGYLVYVTYFMDEAGGKNTVAQIEKNGGQAKLVHLNVSDEISVKKVMDQITQDFGYLDVLVNNAERDVIKHYEQLSFDEWKLAIDSKLHGAWLCTMHALPLLKKSDNANVIMISSSADERPAADILSYATATAALTSLTKSFAAHLPDHGIRVNAVMPGQTRTANWQGLENDDALWEKFANENPMKRVTTVEDVADGVMIFVNDPHKFLNGNFFFVNGGSHLK